METIDTWLLHLLLLASPFFAVDGCNSRVVLRNGLPQNTANQATVIWFKDDNCYAIETVDLIDFNFTLPARCPTNQPLQMIVITGSVNAVGIDYDCWIWTTHPKSQAKT